MNYNHICSLENETEYLYSNRKTWKQISEKHPKTKMYFNSLASSEKERKRHMKSKYHYIVHPLSLFRIKWQIVFQILMYASLFVVAANNSHCSYYHTQRNISPLEVAEVVFDFLCLIDVVMTFFTGICIPSTKTVVLEQRSIVKLYVTSASFYIDTFSSIPTHMFLYITFVFTGGQYGSMSPYVELYSVVKLARAVKCFKYLEETMEYYTKYYYYRIALKYSLIAILLVHCFTCIYIFSILFEHLFNPQVEFEVHVLDYNDLAAYDYCTMYCKAVFIVMSYLLGVGLSTSFQRSQYSLIGDLREFIIHMIYTIIGWIFYNIFLVLSLQMVLSINSSETKYFSIISQVKNYMVYKDLPIDMHDRILTYYEQRFQKKFFQESKILSMLSETLRREIYMHSCRTLIENVSLLKDLPSDVISDVVTNLKHEVFLYNDIIVKAGTSGDCMYFISTGTVAVSTPTGREICHLQDGAYFGEIALVSKDQKRIANVVAIEICEVYRLDRRNFRTCFPLHSVYYKKIEQIAKERMDKTVLLEELHKKYIVEKLSKRKQSVEQSTKYKLQNK